MPPTVPGNLGVGSSGGPASLAWGGGLDETRCGSTASRTVSGAGLLCRDLGDEELLGLLSGAFSSFSVRWRAEMSSFRPDVVRRRLLDDSPSDAVVLTTSDLDRR